MDHKNLFDDLYYKQHNYDGVNEFYRKAKLIDKSVKLIEVKEWFKYQSTTQQTFQSVKKKVYKPIYSESHYSFQIDLTFLNNYKKSNDGIYVLFTAINVNSRYAYVYYSKFKNTSEVIKMLNDFKNNALEIDAISGDLDSAFTSKECTKWFKDNDIQTFFYKSDSHKLGKINRFHRTLKGKLLKYFTANDNTRWIDIIDKVVLNYNNTKNSSINLTPKEASISFIQTQIISDARTKTNEFKEVDMVVGDKCRILINKKLFDKMQTQYSEEIYTIIKVNKNTVDLEYDNTIFKNKKKDHILIIKDNVNTIKNVNKKLDEKEERINRRLRKEGIADYLKAPIKK